MLIFLTKHINVASKGQESYLKRLSGTLEYHILTKGDFEVSNLIYQEKVMKALGVSIYCTWYNIRFQCLKFFCGVGDGYYNLDMFSR